MKDCDQNARQSPPVQAVWMPNSEKEFSRSGNYLRTT
jgi:hypothetical protein